MQNKKGLRTSILFVLFPILLTSCSSSNNYDLRPEGARYYLNAKSKQDQAYYVTTYSFNGYVQELELSGWDYDSNKSPYILKVSDDKSFNKHIQTYRVINDTLYEQTSFSPNKTYYTKLYDKNGLLIQEDSFKTKNTPGAPITIKGIDNVRDLGGWKAMNGKHVKYGMIYRGPRLNSYYNYSRVSETGLYTMNEVLDIKGELDLRWDSDNYGQTANIFNPDGPYLRTPFWQYTFFVPTDPSINRVREYAPSSVDYLKTVFDFLLDENNYPMYVHCNAGADRTGTFAYLFNGLLGVSYDDLTRDFELTTLSSYGARTRSKVIYNDDGCLDFDDSGVMQDDSNNYVAWGLMHEYMVLGYGNSKSKEVELIEKFFKTTVGITDEQIAKYRSIMLE